MESETELKQQTKSIMVRPFANDEEARRGWDAFLDTALPATFLHSWAWGECNKKLGHGVFRFGLYRGDELIGVALTVKITARRGTFLFCPHGPIFSDAIFEGSDTLRQEAMKVLVDYLRPFAAEQRCDFIRISPLLSDTPEHNGVFKQLGFRESPIHMHSELGWILDITPTEDDLLKGMRKTTRYCIRKAEKDGVTTVVSSDPADIEKFWKVYKETVDRQHFTPFSQEYLRNEFEIFAEQDNARFFFAEYNGDTVAAAIIIFSSSSAFYHHGASIHKYPKITAPYLLQWAIIKEAKKRGCVEYNFWGVSPENKPKHPWAGLSLFKRGFGGNAHPYVHAKDLPLTLKYWFNYGIETARRIKRGL